MSQSSFQGFLSPKPDKKGFGLPPFYGYGSDGVLDLSATPAQQITALNGGTVANLTDGNLTTFFVTNAISTNAVVYQIDFGQDVSINQFLLKSTSISSGSQNFQLQCSGDNVTWFVCNANMTTTTPADLNLFGQSNIARYWRIVLLGGSSITASVAESQVTFSMSTANFPVTTHSGLLTKNYTSINVPSGYTVTTNNPCRGMVLYCTGDVINAGNSNMDGKAGFGTDNITPMIIGKVQSNLTTKELEKYFQLTTVLEALKGGAGGNGGAGGKGTATVPAGGVGGTGGLGRVNVGGYGGGGGGGGGNAGAGVGAAGGSIPYAEQCGGIGSAGMNTTTFTVLAASNGGGGGGGSSSTVVGAIGGSAASGGSGAGGGGGGNTGGVPVVGSASSNFAGGLILIIAKGSVTNSGTISAVGGAGANGGAADTGTGAGGGGGGGGAGGGVVAIFYGNTYINTGSINVTGGTGGTGGALAGTGAVGVAGSSGSVGTIVTMRIA